MGLHQRDDEGRAFLARYFGALEGAKIENVRMEDGDADLTDEEREEYAEFLDDQPWPTFDAVLPDGTAIRRPGEPGRGGERTRLPVRAPHPRGGAMTEVRVEQGPLAWFILDVEDGAVVYEPAEGGPTPAEIAAYKVVTTEEALRQKHPEASHVTRETLPGGDVVFSVWAAFDADDPWLVYAEEDAPKPSLVWDGPEHACEPTYYEGADGPLGHGWVCGVCGALLQVG